jgi:hypothetical protein
MKHIKKMIIIVLAFIISQGLSAQKSFKNFPFDSTQTYIIELEDNSELVGTYIGKDSTFVILKTSSLPKIEIPFIKIISIKIVDQENIKEGVYWFPNPNATRYLFGPSAYTLKKGEGYYQNTLLILNSVNFGVSDNFTIGGGLELISTFGAKDPIFFITPKVGFEIKENFHAGGGVLYARIPDVDGGLGILYGIATYGSMDKNITGGLGWGFIEGDFSKRPIITVSGTSRFYRKFAFVTENWFAPIGNDFNYRGVISYGVRFFGSKIAVDLAFVNNKEIAEAIVIGIPFVSFAVKW